MVRTSRVLSVAVVSVALVALSACGSSGGDKKESSEETTTTAASSSKGTTNSSVAETNRTIGKTGWYKGFAITVDTAKLAAPSFSSAALELGVTYENLTTETANAPRPTNIVQGGVSLQDETLDNPSIPGAGKAKGTIKTSVKPDSAKTPDAILDGITIVYGEASDNQTIIPLDTKAAVQTVEPKKLDPLTGKLQQKQIVIDLVKGSTGASYTSGEKGKGVLGVQVKISCTPDCQASGYNVDRSEFSVKTPDGQSLTADQSSPFCCEALYPGNVFEGPKDVLNFKVPLPVKGAYTMTYNHSSLTSSGVAPPSATINVP